MKTIIVMFVMFLLSGCGEQPKDGAEYSQIMRAPQEHVCTVAEMQRVQTETNFCKQETGYLNSYCYSAAIIRNCNKIKATL